MNVVLSADGCLLAVSAPRNAYNGIESGHAFLIRTSMELGIKLDNIFIEKVQVTILVLLHFLLMVVFWLLELLKMMVMALTFVMFVFSNFTNLMCLVCVYSYKSYDAKTFL